MIIYPYKQSVQIRNKFKITKDNFIPKYIDAMYPITQIIIIGNNRFEVRLRGERYHN